MFRRFRKGNKTGADRSRRRAPAFAGPAALCALLLGTANAQALSEGGAGGAPPRIGAASFARDACRVIGEEARKRGLPPAYFARLIWKESAFSPHAVSPKGARGIAQFMAATAAERRLIDPLDAASALAASAHYLADLKAQFGNLGLAAAAYNAGPSRVRSWIDGRGGLPAETQDYVHWITGHPAQAWNGGKADLALPPIIAKLPFDTACEKLALREIAAHVPAGFRPASAGAVPGVPSSLGIKRVEASKPGRVRVLITIGGRAPEKAKAPKKRR